MTCPDPTALGSDRAVFLAANTGPFGGSSKAEKYDERALVDARALRGARLLLCLLIAGGWRSGGASLGQCGPAGAVADFGDQCRKRLRRVGARAPDSSECASGSAIRLGL